MRLILIMFFVVLGLSSDSLAMLRVPSHVGFFRFENAVTDDSGRGNNGTNNGSTDVAGKFSRARSFDGVDDYIALTLNYKLPLYKNNTAFSVVAWVKITADAVWKTIYNDGESVNNYPYFFLRVHPNTHKVIVEIVDNSDGKTNGIGGKTCTTTLSTGVWQFIAYTDDNGTAKFYIDGIQDATDFSYTRSGSFTNIVSSRIGSRIDGSTPFKGDIDELMLFDKALTLSEIKSLMLGFSPGEF